MANIRNTGSESNKMAAEGKEQVLSAEQSLKQFIS